MIDLQIMDESEIAAKNIPLSDLWLVRLNDQIYGPFYTEGLKEYAQFNEELMLDADVTTLQEEQWVMFVQSPLRKTKIKAPPQLVSTATLKTHNRYHLEKFGQRHGPYSHEDIAQLIAKGDLQPTDLISDDEGFTWHKLYQVKVFETKPHDSQLLPFSPSEDSFQRAQEEAYNALLVEENSVKEGLVSFAHYTFKKTMRSLNLTEIAHKEVSIQKVSKGGGVWRPAGVAVASIMALFVWWGQAPDQPPTVSDQQTNVVEEMVAESKELLKSNKPKVSRRPASTRPARIVPPATRIVPRRQEITEFHDRNEDQPDPREAYAPDERDKEIPEPAEPMDVDPYGAEGQVVQNDERQDPPAEEAQENAGDDPERSPSSAPSPDETMGHDGMNPAEAPPVEEVSDNQN